MFIDVSHTSVSNWADAAITLVLALGALVTAHLPEMVQWLVLISVAVNLYRNAYNLIWERKQRKMTKKGSGNEKDSTMD